MERKILVAVDGSTYSDNTLHYLGSLFGALPEMKVHLFTVVPCPILPTGKEWLGEMELMNALPPDTQRRLRSARTYMKTATKLLGHLGIAAERISSEVRLARREVAQDILDEGRQGLYDAIVIGRRGLTKLEEMVMGSISATLFERSHDVPLWIIDGRVDSHRVLVPTVGSLNSLLAVDHMAHILGGARDCHITLFHSTAKLSTIRPVEPQELYDRWGREWCEEHLSRPDSLFHAPRQILVESGIPAENIQWLHTSKGIEAARQILRQALIDDYGTIVIGRRSEDVNKGIFRGVSDRVVLMADKVAIWIVG